MIKLTSSKRFIAEIVEDLNLSTVDYIDRLYSWIEYGLGMMDMAKYYTLKSEIIQIDNYRGILPCDLVFVHSLWSTNGLGSNGNGGVNLAYIPVSTSPLVGFNHKGYPISTRKVSVDGYHIHSDVRKTKVLLVYRSLPKDCDGYPMIPDNPYVKEALMFFIIYRLALKGIAHPIIKIGDAMGKWEQLYPRASNDVNWMSQPEYEEFTQMWNSPLLGNIVQDLYIS